MSHPFGECAPGYPGDEPVAPPTVVDLHERLASLQRGLAEVSAQVGRLANAEVAVVAPAPDIEPGPELYDRFAHLITHGCYDPETQGERIAFLEKTTEKLQPLYHTFYKKLVNADDADKSLERPLPPYPVSTDPDYHEKQAAYVAKHSREYAWTEPTLDDSPPYRFSARYLPGNVSLLSISVHRTTRRQLGTARGKLDTVHTAATLTFDQGIATGVGFSEKIDKGFFRSRQFRDRHFFLDLARMQVQEGETPNTPAIPYLDAHGRFGEEFGSKYAPDQIDRYVDTALALIPLAKPEV